MNSHQIYIDSSDRISGTTNNFKIKLKQSIHQMDFCQLMTVSINNNGYTNDIFIVIPELHTSNFGSNPLLNYTFLIQNKYKPSGLIEYKNLDYQQHLILDPHLHITDLTVLLVDKNGSIISSLINDWSMSLLLNKK